MRWDIALATYCCTCSLAAMLLDLALTNGLAHAILGEGVDIMSRGVFVSKAYGRIDCKSDAIRTQLHVRCNSHSIDVFVGTTDSKT